MAQVLDYSLARPDPEAIKAAGYEGVLRYVAPAIDQAKVINAAEYQALRAAGLVVCLNWEWYDVRPKEGASAGTADAQEALRQAQALSYSGPIYFSVDFDAAESDQPAINAYIQAAGQVIGKARLGAYGGYWPLSRLFDAGLISYGWQTLAWSGANRESRASILQTGATAFSGGADINDVLKPNWAGEAMDSNYVFVDNSQPGGVYRANGHGFYGWIAVNILAAVNNDKLVQIIGLPQEEQHHDADSRWRQRFTYAIASQSDSNESDFRFEPLPAPASSTSDAQLAELNAQLAAQTAKLTNLKGLIGTIDTALSPYGQLKNAIDQLAAGL